MVMTDNIFSAITKEAKGFQNPKQRCSSNLCCMTFNKYLAIEYYVWQHEPGSGNDNMLMSSWTVWTSIRSVSPHVNPTLSCH